MAFSLFSKSRDDFFIVFDVGNASVGGALIKSKIVEGKTRLEVIDNLRTDIHLGEHVRFDRLLKSMVQSLLVTAEQLVKKNHLRGLSAYVTLASPWYISQTKIIGVKKEKPFTITKEFQDKVVSKEVSDFMDSMEKGTGPDYKKELSIVESRIINVRLNGYDSVDYLGKEANEVKIALYLGASSDRVLKAITDGLLRHFPSNSIHFNTFGLAYFYAVRDHYPNRNDFLLMDISGEVTDVSLVRKGVLLETSSFPLGRNFLLRRIASKFRRTIDEAQSMLSISQVNGLTSPEKEKLDAVIDKAKSEWLKEFQETLITLSGELYVPGEVFLAVDSDVEEIVSSWVKGEEFSQYSLTHEKLNVIPFSSVILDYYVGKDALSRDQFIDVAAFFAQKETEHVNRL